MRLIDADALTMQIMSMIEDKAILYGNDAIKRSKEIFALAMVAQAPTIDAVPVIRCKDCKWYDTSKNGVNGFCRNLDISFDSYEWCSRAERRGESS